MTGVPLRPMHSIRYISINRGLRECRILARMFDPPLSSRFGTTYKETDMPRGDKSSYSNKQRRQAAHIADGARSRGYGEKRAEQIAWATVNKRDHGAKGSRSRRKKTGRAHESSSLRRASVFGPRRLSVFGEPSQKSEHSPACWTLGVELRGGEPLWPKLAAIRRGFQTSPPGQACPKNGAFRLTISRETVDSGGSADGLPKISAGSTGIAGRGSGRGGTAWSIWIARRTWVRRRAWVGGLR